MNFIRAFDFIFEDEEWAPKTVIGALVMLFAFLPFVPLGYQAHVARKVARGSKRPLPGAADIGPALSDGLIVFIAWLVYHIPLIILGCLLLFAGAILGDSDLGALLFLCLSICMGGFVLLFLLVGTAFFGMGMIRFAESGNFSDFMSLRMLWDDIRENMMLLLELVLYLTGLALLAGAAMTVLSVTCVGLPLAIFFWQVMSGHLIGQAARQVDYE